MIKHKIIKLCDVGHKVKTHISFFSNKLKKLTPIETKKTAIKQPKIESTGNAIICVCTEWRGGDKGLKVEMISLGGIRT